MCGGVGFYFATGFWDVSARDPDPESDFEQMTGLDWPADAVVVTASNTISGMQSEGRYELQFRTSPTTAKQWLARPVPRGSRWQEDFLPDEIVQYCGPDWQSDGHPYAAWKVLPSDTDWHRGTLLIADPKTGMVWLYAWKFPPGWEYNDQETLLPKAPWEE